MTLPIIYRCILDEICSQAYHKYGNCNSDIFKIEQQYSTQQQYGKQAIKDHSEPQRILIRWRKAIGRIVGMFRDNITNVKERQFHYSNPAEVLKYIITIVGLLCLPAIATGNLVFFINFGKPIELLAIMIYTNSREISIITKSIPNCDF